MSALPSPLLGLLRPEAYPHPVTGIRLIETHISWVLLTGEFAYKLKRPVHYPFVDLRSPAHRAFLCEEELRLNRRFAPQLYLGVSRIVAADGGVRMAEHGPALELAVRMRQFDRDEELDRLIESGRIEPGELEDFGRALAAIHEELPRATETQDWGSVDGVRAQLRANLAECRQAATTLGTAPDVDALGAPLDALLRDLEPDIAMRRRQPCVRECHGDLHARNLVRYEGRLIAFDCLEFEPAFRWIDVADEVAFLWMDLTARRRADLALAFLAGYLAHSGDYGLCRLLPLYACHRALVRAKVSALEAGSATQPQARAVCVGQHHAYLQCARERLERSRPLIVLMSGLSGSGKTWLARQLAPALGAIHLRSDVERKRIAGLDAAADSHSAPGGNLYSPDFSRAVYDHLARCADAVLAGRLPVIVDATFARRAERACFRELASWHGSRLIVIHCEAPVAELEARITARRLRGGDASEADLDVLEWQRSRTEPIATDESLHVVAADTTRPSILTEVRAAIASPPG